MEGIVFVIGNEIGVRLAILRFSVVRCSIIAVWPKTREFLRSKNRKIAGLTPI
jgi:hypothetical protein